jgi:hypothetical protein
MHTRFSAQTLKKFDQNAPLLHYVVALRDGADPRKLGLSKEKDVADIQCVDPGEPYTEGGTVIFKCYIEE